MLLASCFVLLAHVKLRGHLAGRTDRHGPRHCGELAANEHDAHTLARRVGWWRARSVHRPISRSRSWPRHSSKLISNFWWSRVGHAALDVGGGAKLALKLPRSGGDRCDTATQIFQRRDGRVLLAGSLEAAAPSTQLVQDYGVPTDYDVHHKYGEAERTTRPVSPSLRRREEEEEGGAHFVFLRSEGATFSLISGVADFLRSSWPFY